MQKQLKGLIHIFIFLLPLSLFVACSDDEEGGIGSENDLIGTWFVTGSSVSVTINGVDFVQWFIDVLELSEAEAQEIFDDDFDESTFEGSITFNDDKSYSASFDGDIETGIWTLNGSNLTIAPDTPGELPQVVIVRTLTSSTLVVELTETETGDLDDDGVDDTIEISAVLTLGKN